LRVLVMGLRLWVNHGDKDLDAAMVVGFREQRLRIEPGSLEAALLL
jgi:hypothetical protein